MANTAALAWPIRSRSRKSGVDAGRAVDPCARAARPRPRARVPRAASIRRTRMPCSRRTRAMARPVPPGAEDDDVVDARAAARHDPAPLARRVGRADDHDPVAGQDRLVAARHEHAAASDDARHLRVRGDGGALEREPDDLVVAAAAHPPRRPLGGLGQRDPAQVVGRALPRDVELDDLHLPVGEDVGLLRGRDADGLRDRVGRLELGGDHEVDLDVPLLPRLDVLGIRGADDRLRLGDLLDEKRRHEVDLVARRAGDHQRRPVDAGLQQDAPGGAVTRRPCARRSGTRAPGAASRRGR